MSKNKDNQKNILEQENIQTGKNDSGQENYTFVRETIKEKPSAFVRGLMKGGKLLGLGAAFGLGVCIVLLIFNKDIRNIFIQNKNADVSSEENISDDSETNGNIIQNDEDEGIDEKIYAQLADVAVVYYKKENETEVNESESSQETTTAMYREEEVTANISDNKEVQTATGVSEKDTQNETTESGNNTEETTQKDKNRQVEEKKHYTGAVIAAVGDVFVCVDSNRISGADEILISFDTQNYVEAELYKSDEINDLAILRVYSKDIDSSVRSNVKAVKVISIDDMSEGDKLIYAGNPYGTGRLMYTGTLAGTDGGHSNYDTYYRGIITDISNDDIQDGFVFDENGDMVAMVGSLSEECTYKHNITGVCMEDIMFIFTALIDGTPIKHIGIKGETVTEDMREISAESIPDGMYVTDVARDSTAYKAGIMAGDIVVQAGENQVESLKDIQNVLEKTPENVDITLVVKRKIGTSYNEFTIKVPVEVSGSSELY